MIKKGRTITPNFQLRVSLSIIYFLGTWPPHGTYRFLYLLYTVCSLIFILGIFLITEITDLIESWGDVSKMFAGAVLMTNIVHAFKAVLFLRRQTRIRALLNSANTFTFNPHNAIHQDVLKKYTWKGIFHHAAYQSLGTIAVFCWGFSPIADMIAGRSRTLPLEGWYPYNVTISPAFEITSIHQGIAVIIACCHNVAMDTLITGLITVACCQLTILERNLISINNDKSISDLQCNKSISCLVEKKDCLSYRQLKQCVIHSNMIFHFTREIQDIFSGIIFFQFLSNCVIICLIAFNLSQMKVYIPAVLIGMLTYLCCMTYQIFIFCWHGNELHLHSIRIVTAAYSSNWFTTSNEFKSSLQIVMLRAHRPYILTAGGIMLLSLDTFVQILRTSYSIFTVLQSTTN